MSFRFRALMGLFIVALCLPSSLPWARAQDQSSSFHRSSCRPSLTSRRLRSRIRTPPAWRLRARRGPSRRRRRRENRSAVFNALVRQLELLESHRTHGRPVVWRQHDGVVA